MASEAADEDKTGGDYSANPTKKSINQIEDFLRENTDEDNTMVVNQIFKQSDNGISFSATREACEYLAEKVEGIHMTEEQRGTRVVDVFYASN